VSWTDAPTSQLVAELDAAATPATRDHWTRYLKGAASFRGVPMAETRAAVRRVWREHDLADRPVEQLLGLAHRWFAAPDSEDKLAGVLLVAEHLVPRLELAHVDALAHPLAVGDIADWNVCDWYATKALAGFVTAGPDIEARARALARFTDSAVLWQRRAGLVAFVRSAAAPQEPFEGFVPLVLDACAANLVSDDRFAHTGPGWVLRELSRHHPEAVVAFVDAHPELSSEAKRMATARVRDGPYRRR
jgi:3-methyladenine DNA glycosylase AlkD